MQLTPTSVLQDKQHLMKLTNVQCAIIECALQTDLLRPLHCMEMYSLLWFLLEL